MSEMWWEKEGDQPRVEFGVDMGSPFDEKDHRLMRKINDLHANNISKKSSVLLPITIPDGC